MQKPRVESWRELFKREWLMKLWRDWRGLVLFVALMLVFRSAVADWNQVPSGSMKPSILDGDRIVVDKLAWDLRVPFTDTRIAHWANPRRGDVVTFENPLDGRLFVKRVVAGPGDRVEWRRRQLSINGEEATYTPLSATEIEALPVGNANRYHFYRESLLGTTRIVMLRSEPGHTTLEDRRGLSLGNPRRCPQFAAVESEVGPALAAAICRCADLGVCSSLPPFTVPDNKYWMMGDFRDNSSDSRVIGFVDRRSIYGRAHAIAFSVDKNRFYRPRFNRFFADLP